MTQTSFFRGRTAAPNDLALNRDLRDPLVRSRRSFRRDAGFLSVIHGIYPFCRSITAVRLPLSCFFVQELGWTFVASRDIDEDVTPFLPNLARGFPSAGISFGQSPELSPAISPPRGFSFTSRRQQHT